MRVSTLVESAVEDDNLRLAEAAVDVLQQIRVGHQDIVETVSSRRVIFARVDRCTCSIGHRVEIR